MDPLTIRNDFPVLTADDSFVYLDSAASSLTPSSVIDTLNNYYQQYGVNVHRGVYHLSYVATEKYNEARQKIADFIHSDVNEIVFTRGASSALNLVALSYGYHALSEGDEIIVSELEHHSSVLPWQQVAKNIGAKLVYVPLTEDGRITVEGFKSVLSDKTKVVALTYVSNVMGYITPLKEITKLAHEKGAIVSVDAAQAAPHILIDVTALDCDFLSFSGHKMLGPTGIGVLFGKYQLLEHMTPLEYGGDMIDYVEKHDATYKNPPYKFETGTPPIAEAIGLGKAIDYLRNIGFDEIHDHERRLAQYTIDKMQAIEGVTVYNPTTDTGVVTFNIDGVHPHDAVTFFDGDNIAMRAGHHCAQLVIQWLDVVATLRISFYIYNTQADSDKFIASLTEAVKFFKSVGF
ncbi:MAG: cysteine desulfurase [Candidatus Izemoplasma sp.]|nr:cysteine desulfurase [Candidatus Izemoplasma sp.]